jgi:hypothetical protein
MPFVRQMIEATCNFATIVHLGEPAAEIWMKGQAHGNKAAFKRTFNYSKSENRVVRYDHVAGPFRDWAESGFGFTSGSTHMSLQRMIHSFAFDGDQLQLRLLDPDIVAALMMLHACDAGVKCARELNEQWRKYDPERASPTTEVEVLDGHRAVVLTRYSDHLPTGFAITTEGTLVMRPKAK